MPRSHSAPGVRWTAKLSPCAVNQVPPSDWRPVGVVTPLRRGGAHGRASGASLSAGPSRRRRYGTRSAFRASRQRLIYNAGPPMFLRPFLARQLARPSGLAGLLMRPALNRVNARVNRTALDLLSLRPDDRLLDVGFGGGLMLRE